MSFDNRSSVAMGSSGFLNAPPQASILTNRPKSSSQLSEAWKTSSSSINASSKTGWKTSSAQINQNKAAEGWKMSGRPRHAQLSTVVNEDPNFRRHSAMPNMSSSSLAPKPLPQEPTVTSVEPFGLNLPPNDMHFNNNSSAPFHLNTPIQQPLFVRPVSTLEFAAPIQSHYLPQPPISHYPSAIPNDVVYTANAEYPPPMVHNQPYSHRPSMADYGYQPPLQDYDYHQQQNLHLQQQHPQQQPVYNINAPYITNDQPLYNGNISSQPIPASSVPPSSVPPSSAPPSSAPLPVISNSEVQPTQASNKVSPNKTKDDKSKTKPKPERRQITVQSVNSEHRVWIDILPNETGKTLAEKIHVIATFRTRKVVSITTGSGRKIPIDNRPVFGSWVEMEKFVDGEQWAVEWRDNDRNVVDRFFSKIAQGK